MKKSFFYLVLLAFLVTSCDKHDGDLSSAKNEDTIFQRLNKLGFDTTEVAFRGDTIIVEGDIAIEMSRLTKSIPRQAVTHTFVPAFTIVSIYIGGFSTTDRAVIIDALEEFENVSDPTVGEGIMTVNIVTDPLLAQLLITPYNENSNTCGYADFPGWETHQGSSYFTPGRYIRLNSFHWNSLNNPQKKLLVAHEFGHCIGIRHTNYIGLGEPTNTVVDGRPVGAYQVPGTPNTGTDPDPNSVFNGVTCGLSWNGFTSHDIRTIITRGGGTFYAE